MPDYQNPQIPEGINVSPDHPLKEFAWLVAAVAGLFLVIAITLTLLVGWLVRFVPFSAEQSLAELVSAETLFVDSTQPESQAIESYLQALANELAIAQELPEDMHITVHYVDDGLINAFATLGGHVFIFRGLLESVKSENGLALVMAHEIAHIKHRDPIVGLGRGVALGIALTSIVGLSNNESIMSWLGGLTNTTQVTFVRSQEERADETALITLQQYYGHALGGDELFRALAEDDGFDAPEWLRTHPLDENRIDKVADFNKQYFVDAELKSLPDFIEALKPRAAISK